MGIDRSGQIELTADQISLNTDQMESLLGDILNQLGGGSGTRDVDARFQYVTGSDVDGVDYVSGSEGAIKEIEEGESFNSGDTVKRTTFFYRNADVPQNPTKIDEETVTL